MRVELLGVRVDARDAEELTRAVAAAVDERRPLTVASLNLHAAHLYHHDPEFRRLMEQADLVPLDGMPLVLWGRVLGLPLRRRQRVTWVDWLPALLALADARGWRVFCLASTEETMRALEPLVAARWPGIRLRTHSGYFDATPGSPEVARILDAIDEHDPELVMVGMGMPRQEHFVLRHRDRLGRRVVFCAGAAFDYLVGTVPTPPRWAGRVGLEWAFRLAHEPRRLGHRYLVEPFGLLRPALADLAQRRGR